MCTLKKSFLKLSEHARFIESSCGTMIYHSLFSKPVIIGSKVREFLLSCKAVKQVELMDPAVRGLIDFFLDLYILVTPEINERDLLAERIGIHRTNLSTGSQLRSLELSISEKCNFGCSHCIHTVSVGKSRCSKSLMDWDTAKDTIDKYLTMIKMSGLSRSEIHFGTVEPLINWDIVVQCVEYCEIIYPDIEHNFHIETNLSLLNLEMAKFLKIHGVNIAISIDGYGIANDAIRVNAKGEGTFSLIEEKCLLLKKIGYPLQGFTLTMTDKNISLVDNSIIEWACNMDMKWIDMDIDLLSSAGLSVRQSVDKIMTLHHECLKRGLKTTGTWKMPYNNLLNNAPLHESVPPSLCPSAGGQNIAVAPDGNIFICGHSSEVVGVIDDFENFFDSNGKFLSLISSRLSGQNSMCLGCEIESQCAGQCQVTREVCLSKRDNTKIEFMCEFYRSITRELLVDKLSTEHLENVDNYYFAFPNHEK